MKTFEITGTYGSNETPCTVFCAQDHKGGTWYVCEGSVNVNYTFDELTDGTNVEDLQDVDIFTWQDGINSLEELEAAINA
jgi:hypothetical protein